MQKIGADNILQYIQIYILYMYTLNAAKNRDSSMKLKSEPQRVLQLSVESPLIS